jgi:hypothetical protein
MSACAIVSACGDTHHDDATPAPPASASNDETPQPVQSNELQDWARQATSGGQSDINATAMHPTSDALAPPVIHTVD